MRDRLAINNLFGAAFDAGQFEWKPFREGVEIARLYGGAADASSAALLRYAPGARVPWHVHRGHEHILVLTGSQRDDHGVYRAGTLLVSAPDTSHRITSDEGCVVLAIWERPVEILD
jgi:anti-sigma factor ChrR (cupin superfamily)